MKNYKLFIIPAAISMTIIIFIIICIFNWQLYKQLNKANSHVSHLEYNLTQLQKNWLKDIESINLQLHSSTERLQQKFNELANIAGPIEATEPGYQLRSTLRLLTLATTQLVINKDEHLAKELLNQAINKLIKLNDPRLSPVLYNIQDEYSYLLNDYNNKTTQEVLQKINNIKLLLEQLQKPELPEIEMSDLFTDPKTGNAISRISFFKIEILNIYLEQAKLAFIQNNEFLYKQALAAINKTLKLVLWSPDSILEIQEHLSWLATIEIKNYSLLLQAILNLEDLL